MRGGSGGRAEARGSSRSRSRSRSRSNNREKNDNEDHQHTGNWGETKNESDDDEVNLGSEYEAEDEVEARKPTTRKRPGQPSQEEWDQHQVTHLPFRSWCPICVGGAGKEKAHHRDTEEHKVPSLHFDYFFINHKGESNTQPCAVMRERETKMIFAYLVPGKGADNEWVAMAMRGHIKQMGLHLQRVIFKGSRACDYDTD